MSKKSTNEISRRNFFRKMGIGLASTSLLSILGCSDNDFPQAKLTYLPDLQKPIVPKTNYVKPKAKSSPYSPWLPYKFMENKNNWHAIIVHHTATHSGSASTIHGIHKNRGFDGLGYDFIINNGSGNVDGLVEVGYRWKKQLTGAHCHPPHREDNYWNMHSIGIAMIGNFENDYPTAAQYKSLAELIAFLQSRYSISSGNILGHKQVPGCNTACPGRNFSWARLESQMRYIG